MASPLRPMLIGPVIAWWPAWALFRRILDLAALEVSQATPLGEIHSRLPQVALAFDSIQRCAYTVADARVFPPNGGAADHRRV